MKLEAVLKLHVIGQIACLQLRFAATRRECLLSQFDKIRMKN